MSGRALLGAFVLGLAVIGGAGAGLNANWSDHLTGAEEVPARPTQGQGQAIFHLSDDGTSVDFKLMATNIDNVIAAHIHVGPTGVNGPVVVFLYGPASGPVRFAALNVPVDSTPVCRPPAGAAGPYRNTTTGPFTPVGPT